jgi:predicted PurR-regulated permease PerM
MLKSELPPLKQKGTHELSLASFMGRLIIILIVAAVAISLWQLTNVLVLLFGAILISIGLNAAARAVTRLTGIRKLYAVVGVFSVVVLAFGGAFWIFGATTAAQINEVMRVAPAGFQLAIDRIGETAYGRQLLEQVRGANVIGATGWATSTITATLTGILKGLGYAIVTVFVAIYLAVQPERYRHLCIRSIPPSYRKKTEHLFDVIENILQRWLIGQLVIMCTIGVLSGLGLWLLGIDAALALGLMGGLLCFIPYVGAILAAIPATLVALTQGPTYAVYVVILYIGVHFIEGNFITPLVQAEATSLPPVLAILSTVAFGILFGPSGILLAAPLTLLLLTFIEVLYVQDGLGEAPE